MSSKNSIEQIKAEINRISAKIVKADIMNDSALADNLKLELDKITKKLKEAEKQKKSGGDGGNIAKSANYPDGSHYNNIKRRNNKSLETANSSSVRKAEKRKSHEGNKAHKRMKEVYGEKIFESSSEASEPIPASSERVISEEFQNCFKCINSNEGLSSRIISLGKYVYLALPYYGGITSGHCVISPLQHVKCSTQIDNDTWSEINIYRRLLVDMFREQNKVPFFFETAMNLKKSKTHMEIQCVPVPESEWSEIPLYFKMAITEGPNVDSDRKLIKITDCNKLIVNYLPRSLSNFWITFGMEYGFAHVIEDDDIHDFNLAFEVIGGCCDLDKAKWRKRTLDKDIKAKVGRFQKNWESYEAKIQLESL